MKKKGAAFTRADVGFLRSRAFCASSSRWSALPDVGHLYTASIVAVIFSCNPIFVTVFAHLFLHEDIRRNHIIALILELTAALIIIDPIHATLDPTGSVLAISLRRDVRTLQCVRQKAYTALQRHRCYVPELFSSARASACSFCSSAARRRRGLFYGAVGLNLFIDVPLFENIPASAIPALLYICCINSAAGFVCHMMAMEKTSAQEASHFLPKAHLGADLRASFPQGGNSAQYDRRHRLLPDWVAVRDPAGDPCSTQGVESAKISFAFFLRLRRGKSSAFGAAKKCPIVRKAREKAF